jgi:hypothetical protein
VCSLSRLVPRIPPQPLRKPSASILAGLGPHEAAQTTTNHTQPQQQEQVPNAPQVNNQPQESEEDRIARLASEKAKLEQQKLEEEYKRKLEEKEQELMRLREKATSVSSAQTTSSSAPTRKKSVREELLEMMRL